MRALAFLAAAATAAAKQPNFVIFLTDDQDIALSSMAYMPKLKQYMADQGMSFPWSFAGVPVREVTASILYKI